MHVYNTAECFTEWLYSILMMRIYAIGCIAIHSMMMIMITKMCGTLFTTVFTSCVINGVSWISITFCLILNHWTAQHCDYSTNRSTARSRYRAIIAKVRWFYRTGLLHPTTLPWWRLERSSRIMKVTHGYVEVLKTATVGRVLWKLQSNMNLVKFESADVMSQMSPSSIVHSALAAPACFLIAVVSNPSVVGPQIAMSSCLLLRPALVMLNSRMLSNKTGISLWSFVLLLEYQLRELCGVQPLRQCSKRAWPKHQDVEPVPTGTLKWCTTIPKGILIPEGIIKWCDESLNIECQVDTKIVKLSIRTACNRL
jgi:hypothetical protein